MSRRNVTLCAWNRPCAVLIPELLGSAVLGFIDATSNCFGAEAWPSNSQRITAEHPLIRKIERIMLVKTRASEESWSLATGFLLLSRRCGGCSFSLRNPLFK